MKLRYSAGENMDDIYKALCYITGKKYDELIPFSRYLNYRYKLKKDGKYLCHYDNRSNNIDEILRRQRKLKEGGIETE